MSLVRFRFWALHVWCRLAPPFHIQFHIPTALLPESCGCSSMVEHQPSKLDTWVRFPSPALLTDTKNKLPLELVFLVSVKKRVIAPAPYFFHRVIAPALYLFQRVIAPAPYFFQRVITPYVLLDCKPHASVGI